jgi:hypothetical protein
MDLTSQSLVLCIWGVKKLPVILVGRGTSGIALKGETQKLRGGGAEKRASG